MLLEGGASKIKFGFDSDEDVGSDTENTEDRMKREKTYAIVDDEKIRNWTFF